MLHHVLSKISQPAAVPLSFVTDAAGNITGAVTPEGVSVSKSGTGVYRIEIRTTRVRGNIYAIIPSACGPNAHIASVDSGWERETMTVKVTNGWPPVDLTEGRVDLVIWGDLDLPS